MDEFIPSPAPLKEVPGPALWFACSGTRVLVKTDGNAPAIPFVRSPESLGLDVAGHQYLGTLNGQPCYAAAVADKNRVPQGLDLRDLRTLFSHLGEVSFAVAERAVHLTHWDKTSQYCSQCGHSLRFRQDERAKECPQCGRLDFPRLSPAIIVAIEREGKLLLARAARFVEPFYSVLAGFVEPGENLEEAVHREVKEEVGITVKDVRYFGSQPWPFPDSLMIGFTALYAGGEIHIDGQEIVEAGWFDAKNLPLIPGTISIARRLIDWFVSKGKKFEQNAVKS
jgi:NAD+ diphosphatase